VNKCKQKAYILLEILNIAIDSLKNEKDLLIIAKYGNMSII
jgi:hypothetical protein